MIVPMMKYTFLVFYREYQPFLEELQKLGLVHVVQKGIELSGEIKKSLEEINAYESAIQVLKHYESTEESVEVILPVEEIRNDILSQQNEIELLNQQLEALNQAFVNASFWGDYSPELIQKLETEGIRLAFFKTDKKQFGKIKGSENTVVPIMEAGNQIFFAGVEWAEKKTGIIADAERVRLPEHSISELKQQINNTKQHLNKLVRSIEKYAAGSVPALVREKKKWINALKLKTVLLNTEKNANDKLMILEGWVPKPKTKAMNAWLRKKHILYVSGKGDPQDQIPVLLKNNRFSQLFEPIGALFSLPDYSELDLTLFFAPFFMMFFGFCLGDAGYGLLFIVGGGIYKLFANKAHKPYISLVQFLGLATIIFGSISGTFFGINLIETDWSLTKNLRELFFDPNKMFQLSLALGGLQIVFGLFIKAANQIKQFGFLYALSTFGWLIIFLGSLFYTVMVRTNVIQRNTAILYATLCLGGILVLFFNDPKSNIITRFGKGIWDVYSTVTGVFGDLLSYIRLFALGLSSAILGFVINDIGLQILGSSRILGPVFFGIFLVLGHTLNILISSLGSFVHPMRLTFVEFYKNAGFKGGGEPYKPFSLQQENGNL